MKRHMKRAMPTRRPRALVLALALMLPTAVQVHAAEPPDAAYTWLQQISAERMYKDWRALQDAADQNGGSRVHGSAGYEAAGRYIEQELRAAGLTVRREPFQYADRPGFNLLLDVPGTLGAGAPVIMLGAHLDSVAGSPGGDDDGSGASAVLEIARQAALKPQPSTLRFAWWGAEEQGLIGSSVHVRQLSSRPAELRAIRAYLNADMIASPNYIFGIYDPDHPEGRGVPPTAQGRQIREALRGYFSSEGLPQVSIPPDLPSDQLPFLGCGVATGGVASIPGIRNKTPQEQALFGGEAGKRHSPNYHRRGDRVEAASPEAQLVLARALAYALVSLAQAPPAALLESHCDLPAAHRQWLRARAHQH